MVARRLKLKYFLAEMMCQLGAERGIIFTVMYVNSTICTDFMNQLLNIGISVVVYLFKTAKI